MKNGKFQLKHNSFTDGIPIVILLKALGISSDQERAELHPPPPPPPTPLPPASCTSHALRVYGATHMHNDLHHMEEVVQLLY